jgi:hypothetical protein
MATIALTIQENTTDNMFFLIKHGIIIIKMRDKTIRNKYTTNIKSRKETYCVQFICDQLFCVQVIPLPCYIGRRTE